MVSRPRPRSPSATTRARTRTAPLERAATARQQVLGSRSGITTSISEGADADDELARQHRLLGVVGSTLGGGLSWFGRKYGLAALGSGRDDRAELRAGLPRQKRLGPATRQLRDWDGPRAADAGITAGKPC